MFNDIILNPFLKTIENFGDFNAFCIAGKYYSYSELSKQIAKICKSIHSAEVKSKNIGLVANDDIETYAAIYAIWLEGYSYVPLHPQQPIERNSEIILQAEIELIIDSGPSPMFSKVSTIESSKVLLDYEYLKPKFIPGDAIAYILFTSGSTGKPKGVPITRNNLAAFVEAFWNIGYIINENDRCLQPFDLTFDLSIMSYLIPALKGACVYTVPSNSIKYSYVSQLLDEHSLTVALMVPSTIRYLRPYFSEIELPALKYSLFCGEALPVDLVDEWSKCIPNAFIDNLYGPTEDTIFCSHYRYSRDKLNKSYNGIMSIGKSMTGCQMIIINEDNNEISLSQKGELCLAGSQLTRGYWNNPEKNKEAFFNDDKGNRFYKTGDICFIDSDGDIMYSGRKDHQVKVQGFRIELGEIEHHSCKFLIDKNAVAIAYENLAGNTEIALFVEGELAETNALSEYLKSKIPLYMVPSRIYVNKKFPLNSNGKIDRKILKTLIVLSM